MTVPHYLILAGLLPLAGFLLLLFFGKRFSRLAGPLATLLIFASFGLSVAALITWIAKPEFNKLHHDYVEAATVRWIPIASAPAAVSGLSAYSSLVPPTAVPVSAQIAVGYLVDSLTLVMFVMITLIAALIHLFSITYMADDPKSGRYFAYLGLTCFSMLNLVLANSLVQLFIFWGLLGVCSYLLIGFWHEKRGPAVASLKAILINRIGDAFFLLGLGVLMMHVGPAGLTFFDAQANSILTHSVSNALGVGPSEFVYLGGAGGFLGFHWLTWAGLCFVGATAAKSAQFPFHVWLPGSVEAPLPAVAIIGTVTSVAAGIYLLARIYPILTMDVRLVITVLGCITLVIGALIAAVQTDIKKILAYSAVSQIGFMMLFLGAGGYVAGLLHLFIEALFGSCLFLAAGSVMHASKHEPDLHQLGGLWRKLPVTAATSLIATLALSGAPLFSGYYSKEFGLAGVYAYARTLSLAAGNSHYPMLLFWIPALATYLTAFYIFRCWWLTFAGKTRNEALFEETHESPFLTLSLIVLAILSLGIWYAPTTSGDVLGVSRLIAKSLLPTALAVAATDDSRDRLVAAVGQAFLLGPFIVGFILALGLYFSGFSFTQRLRRWPILNVIYLWLREKMFFEALYNGILVNAVLQFARAAKSTDRYAFDGPVGLTAFLARNIARHANWFDTHVIDTASNGLARAVRAVTPRTFLIRIYVIALLPAIALFGLLLFLAARHH